MIINVEQANKVYDILVKECEANESMRADFINYIIDDRYSSIKEWRFQGSLGFGGKFYITLTDWHVSCYTEDDNEERRSAIIKANAQLKKLQEGAHV